jgi:pseudouridylate synthase
VTRRRAIELVSQSLVKVDGVVESNPFRIVKPENSIILQGHSARLQFAPARLWMYHKPSNVVVSNKDPIGRQLFSKHTAILGMEHLIPVAHLPTKAHGLMLLTNDGELAEYFNSPRTQLQQTYHLRVRPAVDVILAQRINERGIVINGIRHDNVTLTVNPAATSRFSVKVQVHGPTKLALPISHIMQHLGRTIERGGRYSIGPFTLSGLAVGSLREVQVPKSFQDHVGRVWDPFIDKDMPSFRRQRVLKLRRVSQFRELSKSEVAELNNYTYDELRSALSLDSRELSREAAEMNERLLRSRPAVEEPDIPTTEEAAATSMAFASSTAGSQDNGSPETSEDEIFMDPWATGEDKSFIQDISRHA